MSRIIAFIILLSSGLWAQAQYFDHQNTWKRYRHEASVGIGLSNYMGDLGGLNREGINWFIWDMEFSTFKAPAWTATYRYHIGYHSSLTANFFRGKIAGSDALTSNPERNYRNLSFENTIYEFSVTYEYYFFRASPGHIYNIKGVKGRNPKPWSLYVFGGLGGFYHNPKADGIPLRPLGTEGQGLPGGYGKRYGPISLSVPLGAGVDYRITSMFKIGITSNYRFTLTDYIDDVSTFYYDNDMLLAARGKTAAQLADRSSGTIPGWTTDGAIRGDPKKNDAFLDFTLRVTYMFNSTESRNSPNRQGGKHRFFKREIKLGKQKSGRPGGKHKFNKKR